MFYHIKICDKTEVRIHFLSDLLKEQGKSNPQNYILDDCNITRSSSLICENVKKENSMKSHLVNDLRKNGSFYCANIEMPEDTPSLKLY